MTLSSDEKIMLAVGGASLVAVTGILLWSRSTSAAAPQAPGVSPSLVAPATTPVVWTEITNQAMTIPVGTTVALSYVNPPPAALAELEAIAQASVSEAAEVGIYPVGTSAPADFPSDAAGLTAYRATLKIAQAATNPIAPGLRVWIHP